MIKKILQVAIKINTMTDEQLAKRMEELKENISKLESLGIEDFDLNMEAMMIIARLVDEKKLDNGNNEK